MSSDPSPSNMPPVFAGNRMRPGGALHLVVNGDHPQVVISQAHRDSTTHTLSASWWTRRRITGLLVGGATVLGTVVAVAAWVGWFPFAG